MSLIELPDFLTVEEAAEVLRLGRSQAYELTRIYRLTGGSRGLPVVVFGRRLRVPKTAILRFGGVPLPGTPPDGGHV
jgi:excisionase family DNA binding protein